MLSRHPPGRPMYGKKEMFKATLSRSCANADPICRDGVGSSALTTPSNHELIGFMEDRKGTLGSHVPGTDLRGMAGAPGFEPGNVGTKNRCLTTWRRPNCRQSRLCGALLAEQPKSTILLSDGWNARIGQATQRWQMICSGLFGPHRHLVSGWIDEVEAPAAGEREDRFDDRAAGAFDSVECLLQIPAVEHGQWL